MAVLDPQSTIVWLLFAGVIAVVLALRLVTRWRGTRDPRAADQDRQEVNPGALNRARLVFLLALVAFALVLVAAVRQLIE